MLTSSRIIVILMELRSKHSNNFSDLISNTINICRCNSHKPRYFKVFNNIVKRWYVGTCWHWLTRTNCVGLHPALCSMTSCWWLDISHGGSVYKKKISKCYKSELFFQYLLVCYSPKESWDQNIGEPLVCWLLSLFPLSCSHRETS